MKKSKKNKTPESMRRETYVVGHDSRDMIFCCFFIEFSCTEVFLLVYIRILKVYKFYYLCGMNLAARRPNIGLPICVSDSLMDFFFRKTFSPVADTTLNSILPEKVAVNDLKETVKVRLRCRNFKL